MYTTTYRMPQTHRYIHKYIHSIHKHIHAYMHTFYREKNKAIFKDIDAYHRINIDSKQSVAARRIPVELVRGNAAVS